MQIKKAVGNLTPNQIVYSLCFIFQFFTEYRILSQFLKYKACTAKFAPFMAKPNVLNTSAPKAHTREKVIATANRRECVYKRTGEPSVPLRERGGAAARATDFFVFAQKNRSKQSLLRRGDPYENRTRVTAVKGRCLNRLTNGPHMPAFCWQ